MPPSIAIATPVLGGPGTMRARCVEQQQQSLGGPEVVRVVLNSSSSHFGLCNSRLCVGHASVHSDSCSRARGSGLRRLCARARVVLNSSSSSHSECFTKGGRGGIISDGDF